MDNIQQHIEMLDKLIAELDKDIDDQSKHFSDKADLISDIKSVGKNCVAVMMSNLPELGKLRSKRIASLVGVIPHPQESGQWKGKSFCYGGRAIVMRYIWWHYRQFALNPFLKPFTPDWLQKAKRRKRF